MGAAGAVLAGTPIGRILELGLAAITAPQELAAGIATIGAMSAKGIKYVQDTSAMGRAGGFGGAEMRAAMGMPEGTDYFHDLGSIPEWMTRYGLTPEKNIENVTNFGIAPNTPEQAREIAESMGGLKYNYPSMSNVPESTLTGAVTTGAKYGLLSPDRAGIAEWMRQFEPIMIRAGETSLNRAAIMQNMVGYMASLASRGIQPASPKTIGDYFSSFGGTAGRTGEAAISFDQGLTNLGNKVLHDPFATVAYTSYFNKEFTKPGDVKTWMEKRSPGSYAQAMSEAQTAELIHKVEDEIRTTGKVSPFAVRTFLGAIEGNPQLKIAAALDNSFINSPGLSPTQRMAMLEFQTGATQQQIQSVMSARGVSVDMSGGGGMTGTTRERGLELKNRFMKDLGLSAGGAASLVGNLMAESGLDPTNIDKKSGATGLAHWLGPRKDEYEKLIKSGLSPMEASVQLIEKELRENNQAPGLLKLLQDPTVAVSSSAVVIRKDYERPREAEANDAGRIANARSLMGGGAGPGTDPRLDTANKAATGIGISSLSISMTTLSEAMALLEAAARGAKIAADGMKTTVDKLGPLSPPPGYLSPGNPYWAPPM
jgi:hypothetical protein